MFKKPTIDRMNHSSEKKNCISVLRLSAFNMVLWVEGPPFVDSCGIFWTKLCDSRLISMIHSHQKPIRVETCDSL